jgi:hypothetical protein
MLLPKLWSIILVFFVAHCYGHAVIVYSTKHNPLMHKNASMVLSDTLLATKDPNKNDYLVHCYIIYKK